MKANNQLPDSDNASIMSPLRNLKKRVKTDMDISLIELLFHVSSDYAGENGCHTNCAMKLHLCF